MSSSQVSNLSCLFCSSKSLTLVREGFLLLSILIRYGSPKEFSIISPLLLFSRSVMPDSLQPHRLQNTRLPCPSPSPGVWANSYPLSCWCHLTMSSLLVPFSSCLQSFLASGSFPMSWLFASSGLSTGASALPSVLPVNIQGWFPLGWTGLISLQSKGVSRVFSRTTVWKHQFFDAQSF